MIIKSLDPLRAKKTFIREKLLFDNPEVGGVFEEIRHQPITINQLL